MTDSPHDWLTLHRVRFPRVFAAGEQQFDGPASADCWRFGPESPLDENGMPTFRPDVWGGVAIHRTLAEAVAVIEAPADHLQFMSDVIETWHALLLPISHRGEVNWRGAVESGTAVRVATEDPGGPLAVLTTAGYVSLDQQQLPRISDFMRTLGRVVAHYATLDGHVRSALFFAGYDGYDGLTCTLWQTDNDMLDAAYGAGVHRDQINRHRASPMVDRTSFTRTRILTAHGNWDGSDPLVKMRSGKGASERR